MQTKNTHNAQTIEPMDVCDEVSVVPEVEGEVSVMESGSTDNDTKKTDSDISSDEDDHDDRWNGVLSNCDEEEVESDYGEWSVGEGSGDGKGGLDDSFNIVSSASGRVVKPLKYLKDFTLDRNKCHSISKIW